MSSRNLSVLLVEDSRVLAERLRETLLSVPGVQLAGTVDSEADAVAALQRHPVDVLLLDLHLRQGTGFGVLRAIPSDQAKKLVVIVLTNYDLAEYRRAAAALGARHFLDKLRDFDRLPSLLQQIEADLAEPADPVGTSLTDPLRRSCECRARLDAALDSAEAWPCALAHPAQRRRRLPLRCPATAAARAAACRLRRRRSISSVPPRLRTRSCMIASPCSAALAAASARCPTPLSSTSTVSSLTLIADLDAHVGGLRVLDDVGQRFLHQAKHQNRDVIAQQRLLARDSFRCSCRPARLHRSPARPSAARRSAPCCPAASAAGSRPRAV